MTQPFPGRIEKFLTNNAEFAKTWPQPPQMAQMRARALKEGNGTLILTCLDPRCVPEAYFGPDLRAGVIRNAGGRASPDVVRSVLTIRALMDVQNLLVVHHTDCGMTHLTDAEIRDTVAKNTPDAAADVEGESYGCFTAADFEETIKQDVRALRSVKALGGMGVFGFAMDIDSGIVRPLDV